MTVDGMGVDLVEIRRIQEIDANKLANRILSTQEKTLYNQKKLAAQKTEFLASRFAAKEAYTKAYQSFDTALNMSDVSVLNSETGAPYIDSPYRKQDKILLSLSHTKNYIVAVCIIEKVKV